MKAGTKYDALYRQLRQSGKDEVTVTFAQVESLIGERLPESAQTRGWWSNRSSGSPQAQAWMGAGYHATVDVDNGRVTFRKPKRTYKVQREAGVVKWNSELIKALRQHMNLTQADFAKELGVRQQTVSEWEVELYAPTRASSKLLTLVAEQAGFIYGEKS